MNEIMNTSKEQLAVNRLDTLAAEIRGFTASLLSSVIEIGRRFHEAKELLPYGEFGDWAREETGYSVSTVNNYMRLFEEYGDRQGSLFGAQVDSQTFGKLTYSKALALLAIEDKSEREAFVEDHDVDSMSTRELQQALRERDEARAEKEAAIKERDRAVESDQRARAMLESKEKAIEAMQRSNDSLKERYEELKKRPVDVATEKVIDQEAIDAAVAKAKEEAQKKIEAAEKARETAERKLQRAEEKAKAAETKAADAGKGAGEELTRAKAEAKAAREEAEGLRKQLRMSDAAVVAFKAHFGNWQAAYQKMGDALGMVDEETAGKLRAAIKAQMDAWGKDDA